MAWTQLLTGVSPGWNTLSVTLKIWETWLRLCDQSPKHDGAISGTACICFWRSENGQHLKDPFMEGKREQLIIWEAWKNHLIYPGPLCRVKPLAESCLSRFLAVMWVDFVSRGKHDTVVLNFGISPKNVLPPEIWQTADCPSGLVPCCSPAPDLGVVMDWMFVSAPLVCWDLNF